MRAVLEWWPDHGGSLFHLRTGSGGTPVALEELPLSPTTVEALRRWLDDFTEEVLPTDGAGDPVWIARGVVLLHRCRTELSPDHEVTVTEPWWDEPPSD